jgi:3-phosphoshikimate 1-carboxyvinyltransferase
MKRVTDPLRQMGAQIEGKEDANFAPLIIKGTKELSPITYRMPVASAQVKSSILFAGLYAKGRTMVIEPLKSRDHTERLLRLFEADIKEEGLNVSITGGRELAAKDIDIPGDISSAAFLMVASCIIKNSSITIKDVGLNPTRTGIIDILESMGARIDIRIHSSHSFEPRGDVTIRTSKLKGVTISKDMIPRAIDELPVCMVAACFAGGCTRIIGAKELRVKETDRINSMVTNLKQMGARIEATGDDIVIEGTGRLNGTRLKSFGDHRTAMSAAVAGLAAEGQTVVQDTDCVNTSFPGFMDTFSTII